MLKCYFMHPLVNWEQVMMNVFSLGWSFCVVQGNFPSHLNIYLYFYLRIYLYFFCLFLFIFIFVVILFCIAHMHDAIPVDLFCAIHLFLWNYPLPCVISSRLVSRYIDVLIKKPFCCPLRFSVCDVSVERLSWFCHVSLFSQWYSEKELALHHYRQAVWIANVNYFVLTFQQWSFTSSVPFVELLKWENIKKLGAVPCFVLISTDGCLYCDSVLHLFFWSV